MNRDDPVEWFRFAGKNPFERLEPDGLQTYGLLDPVSSFTPLRNLYGPVQRGSDTEVFSQTFALLAQPGGEALILQ